MKSVLVIGMGKFGHHLCNNLVELGNDVMIVDIQEEKVTDLGFRFTRESLKDGKKIKKGKKKQQKTLEKIHKNVKKGVDTHGKV